MPKDVLFSNDVLRVINDNIEIFIYEYPEIDEKTWNDFKRKPNCKCRGRVIKTFQKDLEKINGILSKLMGEDIVIHFTSPLEEPIVKEFKDLKEIEDFLKDLRRKGKIIRSASPSPNGKGGFIVIVM